MALDDGAFDNAVAASLLKALRTNSGAKANRDAILGNSYSTGEFFGEVSDGTTSNIYIENPDNSGKVIFPQANFRSGGQILFHKIDKATVDTAGTTLESNNRLIDDGTSEARIESDIAFSGGNSWTKKPSGGAISSGGLTPGHACDFDIVLQEGENVVYQLENVSGGKIRVGIDVDYVEIDKEKINELIE